MCFKNNAVRDCKKCIHYDACKMWNFGDDALNVLYCQHYDEDYTAYLLKIAKETNTEIKVYKYPVAPKIKSDGEVINMKEKINALLDEVKQAFSQKHDDCEQLTAENAQLKAQLEATEGENQQ